MRQSRDSDADVSLSKKKEASGRPVGKIVEIREASFFFANERGHGTLRNGFLKSEKMGSMGRAL